MWTASSQEVKWTNVDDLREMRLAFLIGSPRSGTTWLQNMLASRPEVASAPELGLFTSYIGPTWRRWVAEVDSYTSVQRRRWRGLPLLLSEDEFLSSLGVTARSIYARVLAAKPGAQVVLDKDPGNSFYVDLIARLFPGATFLHLIRDGRDVTTSLMNAAASDWGARWAPRSVYAAAERWNDTTRAARRARETGCSYEEIRYEDLVRNDSSGLARAFKTIGIDVPPDEADTILRSHGTPSRDALVKRTAAAIRTDPWDPPRLAQVGRMETWTRYEKYAFDQAAGELLVALGYANERVSSPPGLSTVGTARLVAERASNSVRGLLRRARQVRSR